MQSSKFPEKADIVIVGVGGIVGSMLAYWFAELGQKNVVGLEKSTVIPSDLGSTAHASDFVYNTTHDKLSNWTTAFSRKFYEDNGFFLKKGGLEICRTDDDARWEELKRKVASGKAFGTNISLISASEAKEKFPLLEEESIRGAMWDPDAGLVVPRSQDVVSFAVESAREKGSLTTYTDTPATGFETENGRLIGVHTDKGTIKTDQVVIASGIWGPVIGDMASLSRYPRWSTRSCFSGPYHRPRALKTFWSIHYCETRATPPMSEIQVVCTAGCSSGVTMKTRTPDSLTLRTSAIPTRR